MKTIIIDFEFTGLDNDYISESEIIETKIAVLEDGKITKKESWIHKTDRPSTAGAYLCHRIEPSEQTAPKFSEQWFRKNVLSLGADTYIGFSTSQDKKMLEKYGIHPEIDFEEYIDVQELAQRTPEYEERLAREGRSLETVYYIITGKIADIPHKGTAELDIIAEMYNILAKMKQNDLLTYMPWGFCAGMPISEYVEEHYRQASGYRWHNTGLLSDSLSHALNMRPRWQEEDWEDY